MIYLSTTAICLYMGSETESIPIDKNCGRHFDLRLVKETMKLLSGKWRMHIVAFLLANGTTRFMDLQRGLGGITARVLSKELELLQERRIVYRNMPHAKLISVEYKLTEYGQTLENVIHSIANWSLRSTTNKIVAPQICKLAP